MAQRNINTMRSITEVAAEKPNDFLAMGAEIGQKLVIEGQAAQMQKSLSDAALELNKLSMDYRIKYEGDPISGVEDFRQARQELLDKYSENVNPLLRGAWKDSTAKLIATNDASQEAWAYEQSYKNKVTYTNDTMKNYLAQASLDGQTYGSNEATPIDVFANYGLARQQLEEFGNTNLGSETTKEMLKNFQSDYIKTFVSGAVETNPERGLKLLEDADVKMSMEPDQWLKFKSATESRAKAVYRNQQQGGVLAGIKSASGMLEGGGKYGYAAVQQADLSDDAREYFESLNGFTGSGKRGGYTAEDKAAHKMGIYQAVAKLQGDEDVDAGSVRVVQDSIFKAMNKQALGQEEGLDLIQQIVSPLVEGKEKAMGDYGTYHPFADSIGFDGVEEFYDNNVKVPTNDKMTPTTKKAIESQNLMGQANLYDTYYGALRARAEQAGVPVALVPKLPKPQREKIYSDAQSEAQKIFLQSKYPSMRTLPDTPNFVYSKGKLIQGAVGKRNVDANLSAKATFRLQIDSKTKDIYRVYQDGSKELVKQGGM